MADYASVIIEGTLTPAAGVLERGERKTVAFTPRIQRLVEGGFVKVVEHLDGPLEDELVGDQDPGDEGLTDTPQPPAKNASRDDWSTFLESQNIEAGERTRDELVQAWADYLDELEESASDAV
jgi:hypothetical protein